MVETDGGWLIKWLCGVGRPWRRTREYLPAGRRVDIPVTHGNEAYSGDLEYTVGQGKSGGRDDGNAKHEDWAPAIRGITHTARPSALASWEGSDREWARAVGDSRAGFVHLQVVFCGLLGGPQKAI